MYLLGLSEISVRYVLLYTVSEEDKNMCNTIKYKILVAIIFNLYYLFFCYIYLFNTKYYFYHY